MKVGAAIADILKREGVDTLFCYPQNPIIDAAAQADIRTVVVRQERTGVHMADALSRVTSGDKIGAFAMQRGPGTENAFGGVAQAFSESVPLIVLPTGSPRKSSHVKYNFDAIASFSTITKWAERVQIPSALPDIMRRAFTQAKNGRPGPSLIETPADVVNEEIGEFEYTPTRRVRSAPDADDVKRAAEVLVAAARPVIYAGQGVHYAKAWTQLKELAELLEAPVVTSLSGKSAFPETHPLALGAGGVTHSKQLYHFVTKADVVFGIGASFSETAFGITMPWGKTLIHSTNDANDINKDVISTHPLVGDAALTLDMMLDEVKDRLKGKPRGRNTAQEVQKVKAEWLEDWKPHLTSNSKPLSPYRVIWDLLNTVDIDNTIITHDSGSPRNQIACFWQPTTPLSYIGWGKSTQLGYGLGLALGAKLAKPDKLCINFWGDAAIGFTGMDLETAARERLPILSILVNNFTMAAEHHSMPTATEKYRSTDISGNYTELAKSLGLYAERITEPGGIIPAIKAAINKTKDGQPALLEFITEYSSPASNYGRELAVRR